MFGLKLEILMISIFLNIWGRIPYFGNPCCTLKFGGGDTPHILGMCLYVPEIWCNIATHIDV
jgi:hypothetical protein